MVTPAGLKLDTSTLKTFLVIAEGVISGFRHTETIHAYDLDYVVRVANHTYMRVIRIDVLEEATHHLRTVYDQ